MPIIVGSPNLAEAFKRASEKARRIGKWKEKANVDIIGICKCGKTLHVADEVYCFGGKKFCKDCKPKRAKRVHVVLSAFQFNDVLNEMDKLKPQNKTKHKKGEKHA